VRRLAIGFVSACLALTSPGTSASLRPKSESIGAPNDGRLDHGVKLPDRPYLRVIPYYAGSDARWGVPELVSAIDRTAKKVASQFPGAVLGVGDLSLSRGGEIDRHHSHESGRDADIGYYLRDTKKKAFSPDRFIVIKPDGAARDRPGVFFDDERNWALVSSLVSDRAAHVTQIFVAPHVRARLLRYAEQMHVALEIRQRASERMLQPRHVPLHDDHFHVRVACPPGEADVCIEHALLYTSHAVRPPTAHPRHREGTLSPSDPESRSRLDARKRLSILDTKALIER
jgi:penicillin-insensitive murein DD-endopeptidase